MRARGVFCWHPEERRSDRYGYFYLSNTGFGSMAYDGSCDYSADRFEPLSGCRVRIVCRVMESRPSGHLGDFYHGVYPIQPERGEIVDLGEGTMSVLRRNDTRVGEIGLIPCDGRTTLWLPIERLYRLHDQTVEVEVLAAV